MSDFHPLELYWSLSIELFENDLEEKDVVRIHSRKIYIKKKDPQSSMLINLKPLRFPMFNHRGLF